MWAVWGSNTLSDLPYSEMAPLGVSFDSAPMNLKLLCSPPPARNRVMLKVLGVVILVSGLGSATSIWLTQDHIDRQQSAGDASITGPLSPEDSRRYAHDVELYYGETGLLVDKWKRELAEWTQGKPLARLIAVASLILATGLFYAGANRSRRMGLAGNGSG